MLKMFCGKGTLKHFLVSAIFSDNLSYSFNTHECAIITSLNGWTEKQFSQQKVDPV